jgi:hypothetical protein
MVSRMTGDEWSAGCVTTPKRKSQEERPYLGTSRHDLKTHVQVYMSTIIKQCIFATGNAFIQIGNKRARQLTIPQGEHGSPLAAQCVSIMHVDMKRIRLQHIAENAATQDDTARVRRLMRILETCVSQLMDDIAALIPYFTTDHASRDDVRRALSEIYDAHPATSGVATFPAPLILEMSVAGQ